MAASDGEIRTRFDQLKPGDRIEVQGSVVVDGESRPEKICGTVVRTEHRGHGPPCGVSRAETPRSDVILLELCDGELTTVTVDESTVLRRA
jgi:hypothetical protein